MNTAQRNKIQLDKLYNITQLIVSTRELCNIAQLLTREQCNTTLENRESTDGFFRTVQVAV